jgi:hypothetical protein
MEIKSYKVKSIPNSQTHEWLLNKHYARTIPSIMHSFGLYEELSLVGVCCFGTPANNHNNQLGKFKCIELVRLCVNDGLQKGSLSYFVSQTLKQLPAPLVIISYADQGKNHHGYIYQATNWIYTGLGGGVDFYKDKDNNEIHSRIMSDLRLKEPNKTRKQIADELGWELMPGTYKHRYFYFLGTKKEKKEMLIELREKYVVKNYPKGENVRYDSSYKIEKTQIPLFF